MVSPIEVPRLAGAVLMGSFLAMELLRRGDAAKRLRPTAVDRGTSVLIIVAYACAVLAIATHVLPVIPMPGAVAWTGVGLGALGFALRTWSMRVLGRFYTRTLLTTGDQHVVRTGPYRLVRHPGYLGSILVWIGAAACSANLVSLMAVTAILAVAYAHRIRTEERLLVATLGEPYVAYRRESWRLLPFLF
jgi:protein-S-isoprenylcysteine O-methyltransferase